MISIYFLLYIFIYLWCRDVFHFLNEPLKKKLWTRLCNVGFSLKSHLWAALFAMLSLSPTPYEGPMIATYRPAPKSWIPPQLDLGWTIWLGGVVGRWRGGGSWWLDWSHKRPDYDGKSIKAIADGLTQLGERLKFLNLWLTQTLSILSLSPLFVRVQFLLQCVRSTNKPSSPRPINW